MPSPLIYLQLQLRNGKVGEGDFVVYHSLKQLSYFTFAGVHSDAKLEAMIGGCGSERRHEPRWWGNLHFRPVWEKCCRNSNAEITKVP